MADEQAADVTTEPPVGGPLAQAPSVVEPVQAAPPQPAATVTTPPVPRVSPIEQALTRLGRAGGPILDTANATVFLALVNQTGQGADENSVEDGITPRQVAAKAAFENWYNQQAKKSGSAPYAETNPDERGAVKEAMIADMQEQMKALNGGAELSPQAMQKITDLLGQDAEAFSAKIVANANAVKEHELARQAALREDPPRQVSEFTGIMSILMLTPEGGENPILGSVDLDAVNISHEGQIAATELGAFNAMADFIKGGGGAETSLARLNGIPPSQWGEARIEKMAYDHLNPLRGMGGAGDDLARRVAIFARSPGWETKVNDGLDPQHGDPARIYLQEDYALTNTSPSGPADMDHLFTKPMVDRGLVSFGNPEDAAARSDWNMHLAGGLAKGLSGRELQERMVDFAKARSDITLSSESDVEAAHGVDAAEVRAEAAPVVPVQQTPAEVEAVRVEAARNAAIAQREAAQRALAEQNGQVPPAEVSPPPEESVQAESVQEEAVMPSIQADPRSAAGVVASLPGESRIGPIVTAAPDLTATLHSVPDFLAVMDAQRRLEAVPSYSPLAQAVPAEPTQLGPVR